MSLTKIFKEVKEINNTSLFDNQATISIDEKTPLDMMLELRPNYGFFKGTKIDFRLKLPDNYPNGKPLVQCKNSIFHPNIYGDKICFSMFDSDWDPLYRIEHYINGLLWLLANPNHGSPLNHATIEKNEIEYKKLVNKSKRGESIRNQKFDNILEIEDLLENDMLNIFGESKDTSIKYSEFEYYIKRVQTLNMKIERVLQYSRDKNFFMYSAADQLKIYPKEILKSVVFINSKLFPIVVVTNGPDKVSLTWLREYLKDENVRLADTKEILRYLKCRQYCIPVFNLEPKNALILVNKRVEKLESVYLESGIFGILFKTNTDILLKNENFKVVDVETVYTPLRQKKNILPTKYLDIFMRFH